jgi:hypothetical protein
VLGFDTDQTKTRLLCWRRAGKDWAPPQEIAAEETAIADFALPRYAPQGFVPVAYTCAEKPETVKELVAKGVYPENAIRTGLPKPWIKLLKVPAEEPAK